MIVRLKSLCMHFLVECGIHKSGNNAEKGARDGQQV